MPDSVNQSNRVRAALRAAGSIFSWLFWSIYFFNFYLIVKKLVSTVLIMFNQINGTSTDGHTVGTSSYGILLNMHVFLFGGLLLILWFTLLRPLWKKLTNPISP